jgi:ketosteroid isomerase-like protein
MMARLFALLLISVAVPAAAATPAEEARNGFAQQRVAWNRGDLEGALDLYWNSPELTFVDGSGVRRGFAAFAADLRKDFAGRTDAMGSYAGEVLEARDVDADTGLLVVRWAITRDGRRLMGGVSTQLWERAGGRWRIVFEHAS